MQRKIRVPSSLLGILFCTPALSGDFDAKLARDIEGAEHSILASLVSHRSTDSKYLCAQNKYACTGVDKAELGLSLIGGSKSSRAPESLVGLSRFKFDAGLSSDFKCYVNFRGGAAVKWIDLVDANALSQQCHDELASLKRRARAQYDVKPESICRTPKEITNALSELKVVAKSESSCD
jgi:hypothetical protein